MVAALVEHINALQQKSEHNKSENGSHYFDKPIIGYASANDPLFLKYKEVVGPFHHTPREILEHAFGEISWKGGTVISWILPVHRDVRLSNSKEKTFPSRSWAHMRNFGETFNSQIRREVVSMLSEAGFRSVAPQLNENWQELDILGAGPASTWSERHAAHAAGLGTFSLNDGLITSRGIAHRCGSVVTELVIPPTARPYASHTENCPFCTKGKCGACITRCPVGAITKDGHNKLKCRDYTYGTIPKEVGSRYGVKIAGCGLCQTRVPCEGKIPGI